MYKEDYSRYKSIIEENLDKYLPEVDSYSDILRQSMIYSVKAGGKRIRPVLLLAVCETCGGTLEDAVPFACALELIHTYSLIHDDHPSIDNDDLRRGKPTNHKVFGDDMAILAGDGLLNSAFDIMLGEIIRDISQGKVKAAFEISQAAGVKGMIAGQTVDVLMTGSQCRKGISDLNTKLDREATSKESENILNFIHKNKTGALIRSAVRAGAVIAGANIKVLEAMTEYAENLGLTFQIVDDILDIVGDEAVLGKKTGADQELGKMTYPAVYGLEASYEKARQSTERAIKALEITGLDTEFLAQMAIDLCQRIS